MAVAARSTGRRCPVRTEAHAAVEAGVGKVLIDVRPETAT
jgi:hypothetical protein